MENKFNIRDKVYHITPDSPVGIVIDWRTYASTGKIEYCVVWSESEWNWYQEIEISASKTF